MKTIITHPQFEYLNNDLCYNNSILDFSFNIFADWWPNIFLNDVKNKIEHKEITYIWDFSKREDFFQNYSLIRWICDYYADKMRVIVPFFPVWTMERISKKWEIATAKYFADILSTIPSWRKSKTSIHIFDIHNLSERFFFDSNKVNVELHTAIDLIKQKIDKNTVIVFPDEWAKKRFWEDFLDYEVVYCTKKRVWDKREIFVDKGDLSWREVIIIDDLIQSWWTIIQTSIALKKMWVTKVSAFATHWVFPNSSHINISSYLDKLYVTDSIPENHNRKNDVLNMEILSIKDLILKIINHE